MIDQLEARWAALDEMAAARGGMIAPVLPLAPMRVAGRYLLEDHDGYPIECPICGRVDRWRMERDPLGHEPRAFTCTHVTPATDGGIVRRTASVSGEQVGGYLDPASLAPSAA